MDLVWTPSSNTTSDVDITHHNDPDLVLDSLLSMGGMYCITMHPETFPSALAREMVLFTNYIRLVNVDRFACQHPMNLKCTNCENSVICKHRRWVTKCIVCFDLISERNENGKSRVSLRMFKHGNRCSCEPSLH